MAKMCFVLSPIGEKNTETRKRSDVLLNDVIKPVAAECGYQSLRADQIGAPGIITSQVIRLIVNAELVIADLTDHNPNVFYEMAIRHATRKPVIQIIQEGQKIPFDVAASRTIFVSHATASGIAAACHEIKKQIEAIGPRDTQVENPIPTSLCLHDPDVFVYETPEEAYRIIPQIMKEHDVPGERQFCIGVFHGASGKEITNSYEDAKNGVYKDFDDTHKKCVHATGAATWTLREIFNILSEQLLDKKVKFLDETKDADDFEVRSFCKPNGIPMMSPLIIGSDNVFWGLEDGKYRRVKKIIRVVNTDAANLAKEYFFQSLWNHKDIYKLRSVLEISSTEIDRLRHMIHALD